MSTVKIKKKDSSRKRASKTKSTVKRKTKGSFEKAWVFWREAQIDMSNYKFDRESANAR